VLGAIVFANTGGDAVLRVVLPAGYACTGAGAVAAKLGILAGTVPDGFGSLNTGVEGSWSSVPSTTGTSSRCEYTLGAGMAVFAGSSFFVQMSVTNPPFPLRQGLPDAIWACEIVAKGFHTNSLTSPLSSFSGSGDLASSVSVLGKLSEEIIMPSNFARGASDNWLSVFFRTDRGIQQAQGYVYVDSPAFFDFGAVCEARSLPAEYYTKFNPGTTNLSNSQLFTLRLPLASSDICIGSPRASTDIAHNRAKILLGDVLFGLSMYGFQLKVINANFYDPQQLTDWRIWIYTNMMVRIEGSTGPPRINPDDLISAGGWGVHDVSLHSSNLAIIIADMRPNQQATLVTLLFTLPVDGGELLRITAPSKYKWEFTIEEFAFRRASDLLPSNASVSGVDADLPLDDVPSAPNSAPLNVLSMNLTGILQRRARYGFRAKIIVSPSTPLKSINTFLLQVGLPQNAYPGPAQTLAGMISAPPIQRIANAWLSFSTSTVLQNNKVTIHFDTIGRLGTGGVIYVEAPSMFTSRISSVCTLRTALGCITNVPPHTCSTNDTDLELVVQAPLEPGCYELDMSVQNPAAATAASAHTGSWTVSSFASRSDVGAGTSNMIDFPASVAGFRISSPMSTALLITGNFCSREAVGECPVEDRQYQQTGRNDRPGSHSNLIFSFVLSNNGANGAFTIVAPFGFIWKSHCQVVVSSSEVFGPSTVIPSNYTSWPVNVSVASCRGTANIAVFHVFHGSGQGLLTGRQYVFRIGLVTNPSQQPADNEWSMEFNGEANSSIPGFNLWTFRDVVLTPSNPAKRAASVITLQFVPYSDVPVAGYLELDAPSGFVIPLSCTTSIETKVSVNPWETEKIFLAGDYMCQGVQATIGGTIYPTNKARVVLLRKSLMRNEAYVIRTHVVNPNAVSIHAETWTLKSYRKLTWIQSSETFDPLDASIIPGYRINHGVDSFRLDTIPLKNGLAPVHWEFTVVFEEKLQATDTITFRAPPGYNLNASNDSGSCLNYSFLEGPLMSTPASCTHPCYHTASCTGNVMMWKIFRCLASTGKSNQHGGFCVSRGSTLRFEVSTYNPSTTPLSNSFVVQHLSNQNFSYSSGTTSSYAVVPLLDDVQVALEPFGQMSIVSQAEGSDTSIRVSFLLHDDAGTVQVTGRVGSISFRFSTVFAQDGRTGRAMTVNDRALSRIVASTSAPMLKNNAMTIILGNVGVPSERGVSFWNITTFRIYDRVLGPQDIKNEKLNVAGFEVLGYISVLTSSSLQPMYYGSVNAVVHLIFRSSVAIAQHDQALIHLPRSYSCTEPPTSGSGLLWAVRVSAKQVDNISSTVLGLFLQVNTTSLPGSGQVSSFYQQSLSLKYLYWNSTSRRWIIGSNQSQEAFAQASGTVGDPTPLVSQLQGSWNVWNGSMWKAAPTLDTTFVSVLRISREIPSGTDVSVHMSVNLPQEEITTGSRYWLLQVQHQQHGAVYATNDMQFSGFSLVWRIEFNVVPSLVAPSARTSLRLAFNQERRLRALATARYELTAPKSFNFAPSCFSAAEVLKANKLFVQCVGTSRTASLLSRDPRRIQGVNNSLETELLVDLPLSTPIDNRWKLIFSLDDNAGHSGHGEQTGFEIVSMKVDFLANNQMGASFVGYFTFRPLQDILQGWEVRFVPPPRQGYELSCWGLQQVSFPLKPQCTKLLENSALSLTIPAGMRLLEGQNHTVGLRIRNAGRIVPARMNLWNMVVRDVGGHLRDANFEIPGKQLKSSFLTVPETISFQQLGAGALLYTILIIAGRVLPPGVLTWLQVTAPQTLNLTRFSVSGLLLAGQGQIRGNVLSVPLSSSVAIQKGRHLLNIFSRSSSVQSSGNIWLFQALSDTRVEYQQPLIGV